MQLFNMRRVNNLNDPMGRIRDAMRNPSAAIGDAVDIAGKYINTPGVRAAGYGLAGAGASVLGNAVTGQLDDKPMERVIAEAIGAGALGAGAGYMTVRNRDSVLDRVAQRSQHLRNAGADPVANYMDEMARRTAQLEPYTSALLLGPAAGGLGGVLGGSVANLAGVPQTVDPEQYQSSNSPAAMDFYARSMAQINTPLYY